MFRRFIGLMIAASALATPAAAQAPTPAMTAFDGKYIGTATISGGRATARRTMTSVDMTITGGQVVIPESDFHGGTSTFRGSVNAGGEVSAYRWIKAPAGLVGPTVDTLSGTIHDNVFAGRALHGVWCHWSIEMVARPLPTMPFDGDYIGVSGESSKTASAPGAECPPNGVPYPLTIWNGIVDPITPLGEGPSVRKAFW